MIHRSVINSLSPIGQSIASYIESLALQVMTLLPGYVHEHFPTHREIVRFSASAEFVPYFLMSAFTLQRKVSA